MLLITKLPHTCTLAMYVSVQVYMDERPGTANHFTDFLEGFRKRYFLGLPNINLEKILQDP